jgi:phosphatidylserine decarboxylase
VDSYAKKIEDWIEKGELLEKGQRIGIMKTGSQVDIVFLLWSIWE